MGEPGSFGPFVHGRLFSVVRPGSFCFPQVLLLFPSSPPFVSLKSSFCFPQVLLLFPSSPPFVSLKSFPHPTHGVVAYCPRYRLPSVYKEIESSLFSLFIAS
jgi:hypothetical protein